MPMAEKKAKPKKERSEAQKKTAENLKPVTMRTKEEARKISQKGGKASVKARREKKNLREAMQEAMVTTFTDSKGNKATGLEIMLTGILANLSDPKARNWGRAVEFAMNLTGMQMTPEQIAKMQAETELTKAKTKAITDSNSTEDFEDLTPLADLLNGDDDGNENCNN